MSDRSPSTSHERTAREAQPLPLGTSLAATDGDPLAEALRTESDARDRLAEFAGAWAGSVYQSSPFFGELRGHLDAYRAAIETRVESQSRPEHGTPRPLD